MEDEVTIWLDEAIEDLRRAVQLQPTMADAHASLGVALSIQQRFDEAMAHFDNALAIDSHCAEAGWNRALLRLLSGDYRRGWPEYEWRWRCKRTIPLPPFSQPRWDGGPLQGRTILLSGEQGLGDTLQFVRYAPLVKALGGRVVLQCPNELLPLLSRMAGIDRLVAADAALPPFDVYAPLMSLPAAFHTTLETIPAEIPYLSADPGLVAHWRQELTGIRGFRVGIAWQGSPRHAWDRLRSTALEQFEPLAGVDGVRLISLQKGPGSEQLQALGSRLPVVDLGNRFDESAGPFMDTAAVLANLDLLVCADTALAHLAGAMGLRAWVALFFTPDWRWLLQREDSPWYPSLRLFRQSRPGDWAGVFRRMAEALAPEVKRRPRPISIDVGAGELIDKITILEIKIRAISDEGKVANVRRELELLIAARERAIPPSSDLDRLTNELRAVNEELWRIENDIRRCECRQEFGTHFVELARSVYQRNDRRAGIKRQINDLLGSAITEEKEYKV